MAVQRYSVIERLDAGGMAEVFKAKATSIQGIEKLVAIKRILPSLTRNKKFVAMFLDEARVSMGLNHANIVQVFDVGVADNTYFIVMEFVEGVNLRVIWQAAQAAGIRLPVAQSIYTVMEVCKALAYAHAKKDVNGRPQNIVHRDVSPPNVMISGEGEVKIMDFGLAKATSQLETTEPGVVKGKFSYLAPEAVRGDEVDARSDIFAAGILLWELLAGERLFLGASDLETVELIRRCAVPGLLERNPEVTPELEAIVMRALAADPAQRYPRAQEFGDALAHYIFGRGLKVTAYDLGRLVHSVQSGQLGLTPRAAKPLTFIDRLIQEELDGFRSLDEAEEAANDDDGFYDGSRPLTLEDLSIGRSSSSLVMEEGDWILAASQGEEPGEREEYGTYPVTGNEGSGSVPRGVAELGDGGGAGRVVTPGFPMPVGELRAGAGGPERDSGSRGLGDLGGERAAAARLEAQRVPRAAAPAPVEAGGGVAGKVLVALVVLGLLLAIGVGVSLMWPQILG